MDPEKTGIVPELGHERSLRATEGKEAICSGERSDAAISFSSMRLLRPWRAHNDKRRSLLRSWQ
ncbi:MAG: hypothetical protein GTN73_09920 [Candidatus Aminicenantes bacterium]|nr:hypothetical protein [Candidatus Aminicenantes bacterium]